MNREDDQQLWDLLGRANAPEASPFFARNVLRSIRQQPSWHERIVRLLPARRLVPAAGLAALAIAGALFLNNQGTRPDVVEVDEDIIAVDEQDYDVIADLDNLLAMEESSLWEDDDDISSL